MLRHDALKDRKIGPVGNWIRIGFARALDFVMIPELPPESVALRPSDGTNLGSKRGGGISAAGKEMLPVADFHPSITTSADGSGIRIEPMLEAMGTTRRTWIYHRHRYEREAWIGYAFEQPGSNL